MLTTAMEKILAASRPRGWVLEPDAKRIMLEAGLTVPEFRYAAAPEEILGAAAQIGYPLVAKVVSPDVLHKTEVHGVAVGIDTQEALLDVVDRFSRIEGYTGIHLEKMAGGLELIVGAKIDDQFGPVILLGMGGTGVEIYQDVAIRMAPLEQHDVESMIRSLRGRKLLDGYRGGEVVNRDSLVQTLVGFSRLVLDMQEIIESIDLNPVLCSATGCVIADARIILRR